MPAVLRIAPAVTVPVLNPAGNVRSNCRLATDAEPVLKETGIVTLVPA